MVKHRDSIKEEECFEKKDDERKGGGGGEEREGVVARLTKSAKTGKETR